MPLLEHVLFSPSYRRRLVAEAFCHSSSQNSAIFGMSSSSSLGERGATVLPMICFG